ncbi:septal ring lytic transglycosylase RlpA family protein [uncultured Thalassolituus sp.]|uniref:septal ring lytic transglycosylase RlpA family protein n=1 Tax=uncultured Thalassolituus sp. TaxID=285273 RepID=UPI0026071D8D|nr:septal ring lytic transglycosylase RlpA family protein [uncultured Thalassolituus sp.]
MKFLICAATAVFLLGGCSTTSRYQHADDFTPDAIADPGKIVDAVPVSEPKSPLGNPKRYKVRGIEYEVMDNAEGFSENGIASWYGMKFHGHRTSNGEIFDVYQMTAAHKHLPLPSYVRVTRQDTGDSVVVRVNDRGPFHEGRVIDLSYAAAVRLGIDKAGTAPVRGEVIAAPLMNSVHWLQIGAVSTPESAQTLSTRVQEATSHKWPVMVAEKRSGDRTLHRVRLGPVKDTDLESAIASLKNAGFDSPLRLSQHQLED